MAAPRTPDRAAYEESRRRLIVWGVFLVAVAVLIFSVAIWPR